MSSSHTISSFFTTSSPPPTRQIHPGASAQDARSRSRPRTPSSPASSAWSSASTADFGPSPVLPALSAPQLSERIQALLRTPSPDAALGEIDDGGRFITTSWGSPYPRSDSQHLRSSSLSSEPSEDSPIHQLEIHTPFLRPAPYFPDGSKRDGEQGDSDLDVDDVFTSLTVPTQPTSSLVSATVLANRARRPARGLTEDWIRQHTTGDFGSEARLWLSDSSAGDSGNSSLSGSVSGDHEERDEISLRTPRAIFPEQSGRSPSSLASLNRQPHRKGVRHLRHPSSLETLRESNLSQSKKASLEDNADMATSDLPTSTGDNTDHKPDILHTTAVMEGPTMNETTAIEASSKVPQLTPPTAEASPVSASEATTLPPVTPPSRPYPSSKLASNGSLPDLSLDPLGELAVSKMSVSPRKTPRRVKKRLPWKGKSILVLLPRDEQRGDPGKAPKLLTQSEVANMLRSWEELGYDIQGFDLDPSISANDYDYQGHSSRSMSRPSWPDENDVAQERAHQDYPVRLPDLNAWKNYVDELNEAKLRALGVSFGNDEPPLPPPIPGVGLSLSRQSSATLYPPLPFSPPIPTSSASSSHAAPPFNFPATFMSGSGGNQSPSLMSAASPIPFGNGAKYNRQSISIPAGMFQMPPLQQMTPGSFSPQNFMMQHNLLRGGSPSLAGYSSVMSPTSPFTPDGSFTSPPLHQRHQSLQFPLMQYPQLQTSARASPRLQDLREIEEEAEEDPYGGAPSKPPAPTTARLPVQNSISFGLQNETNAAEYHLEEQLRSQFEHDRDYSPHGGKEPSDTFGLTASAKPAIHAHNRSLSVQFAPPPPIQRFRDDAENGATLHHPRPHSRGHSLANAYFNESEPNRNGTTTENLYAQEPTSISATKQASSEGAEANDSYEIETNPSMLETSDQILDYSSASHLQKDQRKYMHQRAFSTASNPWSEGASFSGKASSTRRPSHASKASLSNLNVEAPEFKFNPGAASSFQPSMTSQFEFGGINPASEPFQPAVFKAGLTHDIPPSVTSNQFTFPTTGTVPSKINVNAPTFSPGQSDFSFNAAGPKFRPDAPAFTPLHSISDSLSKSVQSGNEGRVADADQRSSIFGNLDLNLPDIVKPAKRSKAVPIVRPSTVQAPKDVNSNEAKVDDAEYDRDGRIIDDSRVKRARATPIDGENDEVLFAEPSDNALTAAVATLQPHLATSIVDNKVDHAVQDQLELPSETKPEDEVSVGGAGDVGTLRTDSETPQAELELEPGKIVSVDDKKWQNSAEELAHDEDDSILAGGDSTLISTELSESTDAVRAPTTTSPSEISPVENVPWVPFEFRSDVDAAGFDSARPMGEIFTRHNKSLSASAKPFTPGANFQRSTGHDFTGHIVPSAEIITTTESLEEERATIEASPVSPSDTYDYSSPPPPPPASDKPKPKGLAASRYATASPPPPPPKPQVLTGPRLSAFLPPPVPIKDTEPTERAKNFPQKTQVFAPNSESSFNKVPVGEDVGDNTGTKYEPTFEEIDDIMLYLDEFDPAHGVNKVLDSAPWNQPGPSSAMATSISPQPYQQALATDHLDEPLLSAQREVSTFDAHDPSDQDRNSRGSMPPSEWEGDFAGDESLKLESRVKFFDGHVNDIVGGILSARLGPMEASLERIQRALVSMSHGPPSSRRERRSISGEVQESDADDEDEEIPPIPRRSSSPRRDRRIEQMRAVAFDVLNNYKSDSLSITAAASSAPAAGDLSDDSLSIILKSLDAVKEHVDQSLRLDSHIDEIRSIVEDAVERRMPQTLQPSETSSGAKEDREALHARIAELEKRLQAEQSTTEHEVSKRRSAEDKAADLRRELELAETKIEVEVMNRSAYDQRVSDLDDKLKHEAERAQDESVARKAAEDRIADLQRLLRISSDEEMRLREAVDSHEKKVKEAVDTHDRSQIRLADLEVSQTKSERTHSDLQNQLNVADAELREKTQEARHWRAESERAIDLSQRQGNDLMQTATELRHLKKVVDTLGTQLEENERIRESWRAKFIALQEDMARAAREVAEESARHIKREQTLIARHEVLDAKLQAEARTRERLESELERLEGGERQAMRAVAECKRLEVLIGELRTENHKLQQSSLRYQSEFQEARESAAREVQRTRDSMQSEIDGANHQVNVARGEFEDRMVQVRGQLDQVKLDADTSKARLEMLLEEAESTKRTTLQDAEAAMRRELQEAERRHQNDVEDMEARYERQINNTNEDAQRAEQNLLERLSISTSKTEHLQDRVAHLEEKLEVAHEAARAAARAAKVSSVVDPSDASLVSSSVPSVPSQPASAVKQMQHGAEALPAKISPQALRESILVLQEQLQQREHRIEELEHTLEKVDPEADTKIAKRDDEIVWLRELLAVRHSDLKDIITALGRDEHDPDRVRDAVIRLQANLQMEEQERERAMNGGSAINLPTIAASLRDAASPRVAQAVGPLAAAWGSWRKARDLKAVGTLSSLSDALLSSPAPAAVSRRSGGNANMTPARAASSSISSRTSRSSRAGPTESHSGDSHFLSGLMTPPASGMRQTPPSRQPQPQPPSQEQQHRPTAFSSTGRRYTGEQVNSWRTSRTDNKLAARDVAPTTPPPKNRRPSRSQPVTPPMMHNSAYDSDAQAEDFDEAAFFDD
ncbi:hypothetical protein SEPCBS57363_001281 [Sporothrix epigloea]|uniref:Myosin class II heavy chain n=1 Tax=Sporothrix epigloea TaxID=1892477 RepID=A0ABP0D9E5_9PEZI